MTFHCAIIALLLLCTSASAANCQYKQQTFNFTLNNIDRLQFNHDIPESLFINYQPSSSITEDKIIIHINSSQVDVIPSVNSNGTINAQITYDIATLNDDAIQSRSSKLASSSLPFIASSLILTRNSKMALLAVGAATLAHTVSAQQQQESCPEQIHVTIIYPRVVKQVCLNGECNCTMAWSGNGCDILNECLLHPDGYSCDDNKFCSNEQCVECISNSNCSTTIVGVCADVVCSSSGNCEIQMKPNGTVCRDSVGICDAAEHCDGLSGDCPADSFESSETVCRYAAGDCDIEEYCTGSSTSCPVDVVSSLGTVCRASQGDCDIEETCTGNSPFCPNDSVEPSTTVCRQSTGECDIEEVCTGISANCPSDSLFNSSIICRSSNGPCDIEETCTGSSSDCPIDSFAASDVECRGSNGDCDIPETCTGNSAECPSDSMVASGTTCRDSTDACDVAETCNGISASCPPDSYAAVDTICRNVNGACDVAETCDGISASCPPDSFQSSTTVCRTSAGDCDIEETCDGISASCPPDSFQSSTTVCRSSKGICDIGETCTGNTASCPNDSFAPTGTDCGSGLTCQNGFCASCAHSLCVMGSPLSSSCDPCVAQICEVDGFCCYTGWDGICVEEVTEICGRTC